MRPERSHAQTAVLILLFASLSSNQEQTSRGKQYLYRQESPDLPLTEEPRGGQGCLSSLFGFVAELGTPQNSWFSMCLPSKTHLFRQELEKFFDPKSEFFQQIRGTWVRAVVTAIVGGAADVVKRTTTMLPEGRERLADSKHLWVPFLVVSL